MKPTESTSTTTGSTFRPGESSVYNFNIVLEEPPAPAARVLAGRRFALLSLKSAAAFLLIAVAGPPGGLGDVWRAVDVPVTGDVGRGEDYTC